LRDLPQKIVIIPRIRHRAFLRHRGTKSGFEANTSGSLQASRGTVMAKRLPYKATTSTGRQYEFEFPLHPDTGSPVKIANLVSALLGCLDRELAQLDPVSNGDVLQALAMAMAVRTRILPGQPEAMATLSAELLDAALKAPVPADEQAALPGPAGSLH